MTVDESNVSALLFLLIFLFLGFQGSSGYYTDPFSLTSLSLSNLSYYV